MCANNIATNAAKDFPSVFISLLLYLMANIIGTYRTYCTILFIITPPGAGAGHAYGYGLQQKSVTRERRSATSVTVCTDAGIDFLNTAP